VEIGGAIKIQGDSQGVRRKEDDRPGEDPGRRPPPPSALFPRDGQAGQQGKAEDRGEKDSEQRRRFRRPFVIDQDDGGGCPDEGVAEEDGESPECPARSLENLSDRWESDGSRMLSPLLVMEYRYRCPDGPLGSG